jgi:hypothetical protein
MEYLFKSNFFIKFKAPNSKELNSRIEEVSLEQIDNDGFSWGYVCLVDKIAMSIDDWMDLYIPSLDIFSKKLNYNGGMNLLNPWLNVYTRHYHQEVHDHPADFSCVYYPDVQEDFSQFYFRDRHNTDLSQRLQEVLNYRDTEIVDVEPGDILFFPGHMLHGVSPHKSDKVRKTLSTNINLAL